MKNKCTVSFCLLLCFILFAVYPAAAEKTNTIKIEINKIIAGLPALDQSSRDAAAADLINIGSVGIKEICSRLEPPGGSDDTLARFALNALTVYVSRIGAEKERKMYAKILAELLRENLDNEVKAFLIRQLQLSGRHESVKALGRCLKIKRLCEPATQALLSIHSEAAEKALLGGLDSVSGSCRVTLIKALGELRSRKAVKKILIFADSRDEKLRQVSVFALANIGDPRAENILNRVRLATSSFERAQAPSLYLLFAQRQAESGNTAAAVRICRSLIRYYTAPDEGHIACSALDLLVSMLQEKTLSELLALLRSSNIELRGKVLELAQRIPGQKATSLWIEKARAASPDIQAEIISMLGRRGDRTALSYILMSLKSDNNPVRLAAIPAAAALGGFGVKEDLLTLFSDGGEDEVQALKSVFLGYPADRIVADAAEWLSKTPPASQAVLIEILAERYARDYADLIFTRIDSPDAALRKAALLSLPKLVSERHLEHLVALLSQAINRVEITALQDAVVAAANQMAEPEKRAEILLTELENIQGDKRSDLIRPLARIGGKAALQAVKVEFEQSDPKGQTAAVSTMANWLDISALDNLMNISRTEVNRKYVYLALQGYIRMVVEAEFTAADKFNRIHSVLDIPVSTEEKNLVLSGLMRIRTLNSLRQTAEYLDDPELADRAVWALVRIALPEPGYDGLVGDEVAVILQKVHGLITDDNERTRIAMYVRELLDEQGFVPLFNGQDLTGWIGDPNGYSVKNGCIVVHSDSGSGNLYTEQEYSDFIFRFEFKLTPGANNGLGIRAPLKGDAAYVGMELQILDNTAPKFQNLRSYQYHGSIYGVAPAKRGYLRPVGEWNQEEVVARGSRIKVILNGVTIVDADINEAAVSGTIDEKDHPGLKRQKGHIGFLGHGSKVEFRNIRIKELEKTK